MEQIYHNYEDWEDYKNGFYSKPKKSEESEHIFKVIELFNSKTLTETYMNRVIEEWKNSVEHNLTNASMNKIAYIGQAACCIYASVPSETTMKAWKMIPLEIQDRANKIAENIIKEWEQKKRLENTLKNGSQEDTNKGYQTKLPVY